MTSSSIRAEAAAVASYLNRLPPRLRVRRAALATSTLRRRQVPLLRLRQARSPQELQSVHWNRLTLSPSPMSASTSPMSTKPQSKPTVQRGLLRRLLVHPHPAILAPQLSPIERQQGWFHPELDRRMLYELLGRHSTTGLRRPKRLLLLRF